MKKPFDAEKDRRIALLECMNFTIHSICEPEHAEYWDETLKSYSIPYAELDDILLGEITYLFLKITSIQYEIYLNAGLFDSEICTDEGVFDTEHE